MKKAALLLCMLICLLLCVSAQAQTFSFADICAEFSISEEDYILLTPDNLSLHTEWVAAEGSTADALAAEWKANGVLLVADQLKSQYRIVISAADDPEDLYDLDQHDVSTRKVYASRYANGMEGPDGITYQGGTWKNRTSHGRFLIIKYKQVINGEIARRGYAWRTIRNGYEITCDYQVRGRGLREADNSNMSNIMRGFTFTETKEKPAEAVQRATFTSKPPAETNTGKFTLEGTCEPGLTITAVVMRMSTPDPVRFETVADKKGKFELDITLNTEGTYLVTATVSNGDTIVQEVVFDTTYFKKTFIPVNIDTEIPTILTGDTLTITGTTSKGIKVQCLVNDWSKSGTVGGAGTFTFKVDTSKEGDYDITLVFAKKGFDTRRFTYHCTRAYSDVEVRDNILESAIKPAYSTLTDKLGPYTGRVMRYSLYVTEINHVGDEWLVRCAMKQSKAGKYSNFVMVVCDEQPPFTVDTQQTMVGTCIGAYTITDGETTESIPGFQLNFWE